MDHVIRIFSGMPAVGPDRTNYYLDCGKARSTELMLSVVQSQVCLIHAGTFVQLDVVPMAQSYRLADGEMG